MLNKQLILTGALTVVLFSAEAMASAFSFKQGEAKPVTLGNDFEQYELLDQVKEAVNSAIGIHRMATSLSEKKETLQKHRNSIERYDEMKNRLEQNVRCNENSLTEHFSDGQRIWQNVSAWAEDSSSKLLAKASDSLGSDDGSDDQLKKLEAKSAAGDISDTGADIVTPDVSESTVVDMDVSRMTAYAKVRWDVGDKVLKDLLRNLNICRVFNIFSTIFQQCVETLIKEFKYMPSFQQSFNIFSTIFQQFQLF